jgi:uncharacterized oligopeptide transporter (OPT) family protein
MSEQRNPGVNGTDTPESPPFEPFIPPTQSPPEFTWPAVLTGTVLGIIFGASSLYLVLKVGLTVSASVPIAVLSITLFRAFSKAFGVRKATILENNIVQTTGSAGESIAFGVGVTMPALVLLGFEMNPIRVMTVAVLGAVLGILMMIPLRRAFIVKQHGKLVYPEGTACAEVLVAGEKGGATAKMVFVGFGLAFVMQFFRKAFRFWSEEPATPLYAHRPDGTTSGLKGAEIKGELAPELLGVGFLIGPRIACLMMAGAVMSYFVLGPAIAFFGESLEEPVPPARRAVSAEAGHLAVVGGAVSPVVQAARQADPGLIRNMEPEGLRGRYLRYIGAGAVAAGGIISMFRALPLIMSSIGAGLRDLRASRAAGGAPTRLRTDRDMPMTVVLYGSLALVLVMALVPQLGLGLSFQGLLGAVMILLFGFLFVTVSSRLTGEVGSSSNPISGMTIATLLMVCLIFLILGRTGYPAMLMALMIAAVVCIASSNGGTTSQDLKTGYLVGGTPYKQQWGILIGAVSSALVIGVTLLLLNQAAMHYTQQGFSTNVEVAIPDDAPTERPGRPYDTGWDGQEPDRTEYRVVHVREGDYPGLPAGRYLVDAQGHPRYRTDVPISREVKTMDNGNEAPREFTAPQPRLFANIIEGILGGTLQWSLIITGVMTALVLELCGVPALPVAVGMYLSLGSSTPIFIGGLCRLVADKLRGKSTSEAESETSPGVLLASGYIAGGTLCGLIVAFFAFSDELTQLLNLGLHFFGTLNEKTGRMEWKPDEVFGAKIAAVVMFGLLAAFLVYIGSRKEKLPD